MSGQETRKPYPSEQAERFIVRMPPGMREQLKLAADRNGRSMNAEIVDRLERSFAEAGTASELLHQIGVQAAKAAELIAANDSKTWELVDAVLAGNAPAELISKVRPHLPSRRRMYFDLFERMSRAREAGDTKLATELNSELSDMEREDMAATGEVPAYVYALWNNYG